MKPITLAEETPVVAKTRELCATILEQPGYQHMKQSILDFLQHDEARSRYETLCDKQEVLHQKHQHGLPITEEEDAEFQRMEQEFLAMPVADAFIKAQRQMHKIEKTVSQYVRKTFELGRVPNADDFSSGGCGPSCGCSG
ncbi:MAG TPA: YlbF family regulator [Kiritimatiellia bacterium]|nr:YlbF family regulator [Kiritimatiellia bacterium]HMO98513.1 YlbF family regulator [Kiritimatiellia bacterium]HMP95821.1 YlbF family regulator [Kiritimatiellia bacterium]